MPPDATILTSLAIGLVIAGIIILAWTFRAAFARALGPLNPSKSPPTAESPARTALDAAMDDAEELAQLIADRLDRQAARLEQLIAAADDRLARLERAIAALPTQEPTPRRETTDPLSRQIYDLSDQGLPPVEIARHLNQHTGKVELILALRRK